MSKGCLHEQYKMEELLPIVAELSEKYTSGENTSITYEKAEQLMEAVMYCIDECEDEAYQCKIVGNSMELSAREAYVKGYQLVLEKAKRVKEQYNAMILSFDSYGNTAYEETVVKGMPGFFLYYDPKFMPQNHILTLDYPVLGVAYDSCGVDVMETYIDGVCMEQAFLEKLPKEYCLTVLEQYHPDYQELLLNISAIIMRNLLGALMAEKPMNRNGFRAEDLENIREQVNGLSVKELQQELLKLLRIFLKQVYQGQAEELIVYFEQDLPDFAFELKNAVEHDALTAFFVY